MRKHTIDNGRIATTATRMAGGTILAMVFLLSAPAFAGRFTEYDAGSRAFATSVSHETGASASDAAGVGHQQAKSDSVMTDAIVVSGDHAVIDGSTARFWWQAPGNPQFGGR